MSRQLESASCSCSSCMYSPSVSRQRESACRHPRKNRSSGPQRKVPDSTNGRTSRQTEAWRSEVITMAVSTATAVSRARSVRRCVAASPLAGTCNATMEHAHKTGSA